MAEKVNKWITPKAIVTGWVNIVKPDTKFNPEGDYKIKVRIPSDAKGLPDILEGIDKAKEEARAAYLEDFKKNPKNRGKRPVDKEADLPYYEDTETGEIVMSFKSKASYTDRKTQEVKKRVVPVFGGNGRLKPNEIPAFGEGSEVKIAFLISGFCNAALGAGVSLRLDSVKLIKPVEFSGSAADPFGDDEEGYVPEGDGFGDDDDEGGYSGGSDDADQDDNTDDSDGDF